LFGMSEGSVIFVSSELFSCLMGPTVLALRTKFLRGVHARSVCFTFGLGRALVINQFHLVSVRFLVSGEDRAVQVCVELRTIWALVLRQVSDGTFVLRWRSAVVPRWEARTQSV